MKYMRLPLSPKFEYLPQDFPALGHIAVHGVEWYSFVSAL